MKNPASEKFLPLLSTYVDGELTAEERRQVEQYLANNPGAAAYVADLRAADALMRHAFELQADDLDGKAFTEAVLSNLMPDRLPWLKRLELSWSELFRYRRGPLLVGLASAAAAVAIAIPLTMKLATPAGSGASRLQVQTVSADVEGQLKPVVMETESGDAVIWAVEGAKDKPDAGKQKSHRKESGEEEAVPDEGEL